jgi:hypothetical protein
MMGIGSFFDRTPAIHRSPHAPSIDRNSGGFDRSNPTQKSISIHVSRPNQEEEALPGGVQLQDGDVVVHADESHGIEPGDELEFWDDEWHVEARIRGYDILRDVVGYHREAFLVRQA